MNSLSCRSESRNDREGKFPSHPSKEWLYVGHYIDINGNYILKVGTTIELVIVDFLLLVGYYNCMQRSIAIEGRIAE